VVNGKRLWFVVRVLDPALHENWQWGKNWRRKVQQYSREAAKVRWRGLQGD